MTALRTLQQSLTFCVGAAVVALGLILLALFGLATIIIPASVGILAIELTRTKRWLLGRTGFSPRGNNLLTREAP